MTVTLTKTPRPWLFLHHKCASLWSRALFAEHATVLGCGVGALNSVGREPLPGELRSVHEHAGACGLCIEDNAWPCTPSMIDDLLGEDWRGVHIYRDPRDLLVSAYFSHRNSHSSYNWAALAPVTAQLREISKEDGLILELDWVEFAIGSVINWPWDHPRVLNIDFADLFAQPVNRVTAAFTWLFPDRDYLRMLVSALLKKRTFEQMTSEGGARARSKGEEDVDCHYRKGVAGDYVNHFTDRVHRAFLEKYGEAFARGPFK